MQSQSKNFEKYAFLSSFAKIMNTYELRFIKYDV